MLRFREPNRDSTTVEYWHDRLGAFLMPEIFEAIVKHERHKILEQRMRDRKKNRA